ncbi:patatin-like phospholipase family protein [Thalassobaculum sp.]|uniref:patatin-like phospholipase family protein n=1 Tax=Thalassobaculum sp. TaxID=2022740 RepID=UPI0032ED72AA
MSAGEVSDPEPDAGPGDDPARQEAHVPGHLREEAAAAAEPGRRQPGPVEPDTVKTLNLALQGGGSHGAFTWGVLDRLLEDGRVEFDSLCGTSAGAMNAVVFAAGWAENGRTGARERLDRFWNRIADVGAMSPIQRTVIDTLMGNWRIDSSPGYIALDLMGRVLSPYQTNPLNLNPLRDVLEEVVDIDLVRYASGLNLFLCATNVHTGKVKVFDNKQLSIDAVMASACLPFMFQAVEIDGEHYYDGGYMGNPALFPLAYNSDCRDVLIVQINPLYRKEVPTSARDILDRVNEITFNSSLMREMRAVHFVNRLIAGGKLDPQAYRITRIHMIQTEGEIAAMHASSKLNPERLFLHHLRDIGRRVAGEWIDAHLHCVGVESSVDVRGTFL